MRTGHASCPSNGRHGLPTVADAALSTSREHTQQPLAPGSPPRPGGAPGLPRSRAAAEGRHPFSQRARTGQDRLVTRSSRVSLTRRRLASKPYMAVGRFNGSDFER